MKKFFFKKIIFSSLMSVYPLMSFSSCSANPYPIKPENVYITENNMYNFLYQEKTICSFLFNLENFAENEVLMFQIVNQKKDGVDGEYIKFKDCNPGELFSEAIAFAAPNTSIEVEQILTSNEDAPSIITFSLYVVATRNGMFSKSFNFDDLTIYMSKPTKPEYFLSRTTQEGDKILEGLDLTNYSEEINQCNLLVIPNDFTEIAANAFYKNLSSTIPPSIKWLEFESNLDHTTTSLLTIIGTSAFKNAKFTQSITFPNSLMNIRDSAFENCDELDGTINLPNKLKTLGTYCFSGCSKIKKVSFSPTLTTIPGYAFSNCSQLDNVQLPEEIIKIGDNAFEGTHLTNFVLPKKITEIGQYAFSNCQSLSYVDFRKSEISDLMTINDYAFANCSSLDLKLQLPDCLQKIGDCAFWGCAKIHDNLRLPKQIKHIGKKAFCNCASITGSLFLSSVAFIGEEAFADWSGHVYEIDASRVSTGEPPTWITWPTIDGVFRGFPKYGLFILPKDFEDIKIWEQYLLSSQIFGSWEVTQN